MTALAVHMEGIRKAFNGIPVLRGVDFEMQPGEVHALVGGNGAGKSTLMKILQGVYTPDAGTIKIDGRLVQLSTPRAAQAQGIGMVFQEFSLIPTLTVAQNIFLTREPRDGVGFLNDAEAERRTRALFNDLGVDINPRAVVAGLSTGYWQLTEIAKALSQNARVLIMDEPTASLTGTETQSLFDLIRTLKSRGLSLIYISHRMEEIFQIADRVTVLRDGEIVVTAPCTALTINQVIENIVGRKMEQAFAWQARTIQRDATPLLEVRGLRAGPRVQGMSFQLHRGEILGLAGLMGSGRTELARALFGIDPIQAGQIRVNGQVATIRSPQDALGAGLCLIPEDRRAQGLVLDHTLKHNLLLPLLDGLSRHGLIDDEAGDRLAQSYVADLAVKTDSIHKVIRYLSGGNQQKVVIAKWLAYKPEILLMDEPTAGVDIGAKTEILDIIRKLADQGKGVIVISSEFTELLAVADRVLIIRNGAVTQALDRPDIETEEVLHHAVQRASAAEVRLTEAELAQIRAKHATAAIALHYSGDDWTTAQIAGLKSQFGQMGIEVVAVTDANFEPQKQVRDLDALIAQKPDIIVSIPTDTETTTAAYKKAAAAGIKLIFMDNVPHGLMAGKDYVSVVSADNYGAGVIAAQFMIRHLNGQGQIGLIYHAADFFATQQRYDGFKKTIQEKAHDIQIVAERGLHGPDFSGEAEAAAGAMLADYPELIGIWAVWDIPAQGVMNAIRRAGRNEMIITTCDLGQKVAIEIAQDGLVTGLSAQRPYDQGVTEALLAGYALLDKPAPAHVVIGVLPVTSENVLDAWRTVYRQDPSPELAAALNR
ncbi:MAG: ATP-binding cassette domain-containing protein [Anaerolineales bacterium]|nr:ATP-binding cassette domain-containing protein [Anaerolineales bacterium]